MLAAKMGLTESKKEKKIIKTKNRQNLHRLLVDAGEFAPPPAPINIFV